MSGFGWHVTCVRCPDWFVSAWSEVEAHEAMKAHYRTDEHQAGQAAYEASLCPTCHGTGLRDE